MTGAAFVIVIIAFSVLYDPNLRINHSQKLFMYSLTPGQDNENEAKLGIFIINMAADQVKKRDEFCCVPNCNGNARIHKDLRFHHIPSVKKTELRKAWIIAIRRDEGPLFKVCDVCTCICLLK